MPYPEGLPPEELPADPFDHLSIPETLAFVFRKEGEAGSRELLARPLPNGGKYSREDWLDWAAELKGAGLTAVAAILTELSSSAPAIDSMVFCPYLVSPYSENPRNQTNISHWLRAQRQRQEQRQAAREERLRPMGKPGRPKAKPA